MSVVRSLSCGDAGSVPNPFWSRRVADEWHLQRARPELLPPVPQSEDGDDEVVGREPRRGRSRSRHGETLGSVFATPPSWKVEEARESGAERGEATPGA